MASDAAARARAGPAPEPPSDAELMRRAGLGDAAAFRAIVERHVGLVHSIAWRMLGGSDVEDVVQDVFAKLWVQAPGWAPAGGGLGGWLRRVATNACLDRLRQGRRQSDAPVPESPDPAPAADERIDAERDARRVEAAIAALPERQRAALILTYYEGTSNVEAAAILGIGVKALESLLSRARETLRGKLAPARSSP